MAGIHQKALRLVTPNGDTVADEANNALRVNVIAGGGGGGGGGTSALDEADFTPTVTPGTPMMGARDDAGTDTVAEDKLGVPRITEFRALHVNLRSAAGAEVSPGTSAVAVTDRSGMITNGGASQQIAAANANRKGFDFYNRSETDVLWLEIDGNAAVQDSPSIPFMPGAFRIWDSAIPSGAINVIGATTGSKFSAKEYG